MSDAVAATAAPMPPTAPAAMPPGVSTSAPGAGGDEAKAKRLANATHFLRNAQVRASPLARRVTFLKNKGLSVEEIVEAFSRAGQSQSADTIREVFNNPSAGTAPSTTAAAPTAPAATPTATHTSAPSPAIATVSTPPGHYHPAAGAPPLPAGAPPPHVQYVYAHPPPAAPAPAASSGGNSAWTWKDYFIGATVAAAGSAAAVKLFTTFSPYDIVRKDQMGAPPPPARPPPPSMQFAGTSANGPLGVSSMQSFGAFPGGQASGVFPSAAAQFDSASAATRPPLTPPPTGADQSAPVIPQVAPIKDGKDDEIAKLKTDLEASEAALKEAKADLDKVRREKAEMAVTLGKLRGQVATQQRTIDRAEQGVEAKVNERVKEELERRAATANAPAATAADGAALPAAATPPPSAAADESTGAGAAVGDAAATAASDAPRADLPANTDAAQ